MRVGALHIDVSASKYYSVHYTQRPRLSMNVHVLYTALFTKDRALIMRLGSFCVDRIKTLLCELKPVHHLVCVCLIQGSCHDI